jgi:hypothetical protein
LKKLNQKPFLRRAQNKQNFGNKSKRKIVDLIRFYPLSVSVIDDRRVIFCYKFSVSPS